MYPAARSALLLLSFFATAHAIAQTADSDPARNDHMFPAAAAARSTIDFDQRGFLIDGKRTFLASAGLEYARIPRGLWADRLLRLKRAGFNTVEFYTFWDFHEPREGQFDFTGDHDLNAFLQLVKSMHMYAIARVGPYSCAEWSLGGYPIWLRFKPGLILRSDNAPFLKAVDDFWDKLLPIIAANQINHGGAVVLVQLENEHPLAWGTVVPNPYFAHLQQQALHHGIQVPYFFSGMHHGSDPAGDQPSLDDPSRPNPWISTEFWSVWFSQYGSRPEDALSYRRRTWKIIAHGGEGYNIYMAHGGSNFDYSNNNEDAASYDYGAPVGQGGDLRPTYYEFKRANYFARSFSDVLENSTDNSPQWATSSSNREVKITARKGPAGEILFLDNPPAPVKKVASPDANNPTFEAVTAVTGNGTAPTSVVVDGAKLELALAPGEILPLIHGFQVAPGVTLRLSSARVLGLAHFGHTTTLVVYGDAGRQDRLLFSGAALQVDGSSATTPELSIEDAYVAAAPVVRTFSAGLEHVRVLLMTRDQADHTWIEGETGHEWVVTGPLYLGAVDATRGKLSAQVESPWTGNTAASTPVAITAYGENGAVMLEPSGKLPDRVTTIALGPWQMRTGAAVDPGFNDSAWPLSADPAEMGADGDLSSYAWYRSKVTVQRTGDYLLTPTEGGDHAKLYADGHFIMEGSFSARPLPLTLTAGTHSLAIFVSHYGRQKLFSYLGAFAGHDPKGLAGAVTLRQGTTRELTGWRVQHVGVAPEIPTPPPADAIGWKPATIGGPRAKKTPENSGAAWFQTSVQAIQPQGRRVLRFTSVDENATVYVNGRRVGSFKGRDQAFSAEIPADVSGTLLVSVLVEGRGRPHAITGPVLLEQTEGGLKIEGWRSHGGPEVAGDPAPWHALGAHAPAIEPMFYKSTFELAPQALAQRGESWRISTEGLGHGSVWLNGHNLGRYPELIQLDGEYMPPCWMHAGTNEIVIYDEDGRAPNQVHLYAEPGASRDVASYLGTLHP